jgi:hypothetical protein
MDKDYFWKMVCPKLNVGLSCNHNKMTISQTEHERVLVSMLITVEMNKPLCLANDGDIAGDHDQNSVQSNDERIFSHGSQQVNAIKIDDEDGDDKVSEIEHALRLATSMKNSET